MYCDYCCTFTAARLFCFTCITAVIFRCQIASPACTELEMVVMDWLAKLLDLPGDFLSTGKGGGVIQVYIHPYMFICTKQFIHVC